MLGKLLKYEFLATGRVFLPLFAALIVATLINRLLSNLSMAAPAAISMAISVILMVGIGVLTFILILQRFRNNLLSNEGYLMMTLPVQTDSLILSKLITSMVWCVASFLVVMLSIVILSSGAINFSEIFIVIRQFFEMIRLEPIRVFIYSIEAIAVLILTMSSGILLLYASMALSMMVNKRRGLFTFGAFIVLSTALQIVITIIVSIADATGVLDLLSFTMTSTFGQTQVAVLVLIGTQAAVCAVYYFITRYMLKNHLNLQ